MSESKVKKIVEHICCDHTHGSLISMCRFYYHAFNRNENKAKRHELEQIAFIIYMLDIDPAGIYEISAGGKVIKELVYAPQAIKYILTKTIFNWYESPEYPVTRDQFQEKVTIKKIATRTI